MEMYNYNLISVINRYSLLEGLRGKDRPVYINLCHLIHRMGVMNVYRECGNNLYNTIDYKRLPYLGQTVWQPFHTCDASNEDN